jgi:hypothetical protein
MERIPGFEPVEAEDDAKAIRDAEARQRVLGIELWCAHRLVKRWDLLPADASVHADTSIVEAPWQQ